MDRALTFEEIFPRYLEIWSYLGTNLGILAFWGRIYNVSQRPYSLDLFPDVPSILNLGANSLKVGALVRTHVHSPPFSLY